MRCHPDATLGILAALALLHTSPAQDPQGPEFELHQPELFADGGTFTNAFADYDNDGDLDLFVGFNNEPNRLYRNNGGTFVDVAAQVGLADSLPTRAAAWGDFNGDGHLDLFIGYAAGAESGTRLYANDGDGRHFSEVSGSVGLQLSGSFRQASWVDYDNDGDLDLFVGLRDRENALLKNTDGQFTDVAGTLGIADARRTVGAVWFDYDKDGDLDCYVTNMDGDANGLFRNDGSGFVDVAEALGVDTGGRPLGSREFGSVRPTLVDYDNDGNLDIFTANYGSNGLFRNLDGEGFENVASELGLAIDSYYDTGIWGDFDNDGRVDLYVNGTVSRGQSFEDYIFQNTVQNGRTGFTDVTPAIVKAHNGDHGAQWADFDRDGDLDLALTGAPAEGMHQILRNEMPRARAQQSLQVVVLDGEGHYTRSGSEVRLYDASSKELLGTSLMDTGSGYNSQNAMPVHFGLAGVQSVDVEVTVMTTAGRKTIRVPNVDPKAYQGRHLTVKVDANGRRVQ